MPTWLELKTEIEADYDLAEETWIKPAELMSAANTAISSIEKQIHTFHDKYFETEGYIPLTASTSIYNLPADIFAVKITGIYFNNGSEKYEIKPIKSLSDTVDVDASEPYKYRIINTSASGLQLKLYPPARETHPTAVTMFYKRNANLFTVDASELDIPEAKDFVKQYVIDFAVNKERMTPDAPESPKLQTMRKDLLDSLENMIDDDNTGLDVDYSYYEEFT